MARIRSLLATGALAGSDAAEISEDVRRGARGIREGKTRNQVFPSCWASLQQCRRPTEL